MQSCMLCVLCYNHLDDNYSIMNERRDCTTTTNATTQTITQQDHTPRRSPGVNTITLGRAPRPVGWTALTLGRTPRALR